MANPSACVTLEIDSSKYSSFVPVIGVYVAGASAVCFLAMLYDIFCAFQHKKTWIPCKFFSLNSLTLTLLAIAAKIPVDLTTPMPSALDQVSKLSGNIVVCISMGFFMPSLGQKRKHDCLTNTLALSIFVVTLIVNTCIQIHTRVIFLFITQHIITMCCMLAMLYPLWLGYTIVVKHEIYSDEEQCRVLVRYGEGSMLDRLKLAYSSSYKNEPRATVYALSRNLENYTVVGLCIVSVVSLVQPAIRNFSLEFCGGSSDYGRSVWVIVLVQILTVLAGSVAIVIRASGLSRHLKRSGSPKILIETVLRTLPNFSCAMHSQETHGYVLELVLKCISWLLHALVCLPVGIAFAGFGLLLKSNPEDQNSFENVDLVGNWVKICDIEELMDPAASFGARKVEELMNKSKTNSEYLSMFLKGIKHREDDEEVSGLASTIKASYVSVAMLIQIARVLLPHDLYRYLEKAHGEASEILNFKFSIIEPNKGRPPSLNLRRSSENMEVDRILGEHKYELASGEGLERREALGIIKFIEDRYRSIQLGTEHQDSDRSLLFGLVAKMFVVMFRTCIQEIPDFIYEELVTGRWRENMKRLLSMSVVVLCKIEWLESNEDSVFPAETNVRTLISALSSCHSRREHDRLPSVDIDIHGFINQYNFVAD